MENKKIKVIIQILEPVEGNYPKEIEIYQQTMDFNWMTTMNPDMIQKVIAVVNYVNNPLIQDKK